MQIKDAILDFGTMPYSRRLVDRALYPISDLNYLTGGMELGEISCIAAASGSGKSTFLSQTLEEIIKYDRAFAVFGESTAQKQQQAMYRQMAGFGADRFEYVQFEKAGKKTNIGQYFVNEETAYKIQAKTKGKLFLYDRRYGMTMDKILEVFRYCHENGGINYFAIDNLMMIENITNDELRETKDNVERLLQYVVEANIHVILVAHYRKVQDVTQIRQTMDDIAGTSTVAKKCGTIIGLIRLDKVDKKGKPYKNLGSLLEANNGVDIQQCDAVIEVMKTRFNRLGFVPLKFNQQMNAYYQPKEWERSNSSNGNDYKPKLQADSMAQSDDELDELPF